VRLERLDDALLLGPSHYSIGLQAADLVVASGPRLARHPDTGETDGVGLVVWPTDPGRVVERPGKLFPG
jgi:hypothetical protein